LIALSHLRPCCIEKKHDKKEDCEERNIVISGVFLLFPLLHARSVLFRAFGWIGMSWFIKKVLTSKVEPIQQIPHIQNISAYWSHLPLCFIIGEKDLVTTP